MIFFINFVKPIRERKTCKGTNLRFTLNICIFIYSRQIRVYYTIYHYYFCVFCVRKK